MFDRIYLIMVESFIHDYFGSTDITGYGCGYGNSSHLGNIKGITKSIPYISNLGMDSIWVTPVFDSKSGESGGSNLGNLVNCKLDSTGYFARDYFSIDPLFGSLGDYKEMVETAHSYGLSVIMDFAIGHNKGNVRISPGGFKISNKVNFNEKQTVDFFKELFVYWIKKANIDGFRLDQAYQAPQEVWVELRKTVGAYNKFFFLGEILCQGKLSYKNGLGQCHATLPLSLESQTKNVINLTSSSGLNYSFDFGMMYRLRECIAGIDINGSKVSKIPDTSYLVDGFKENENLKPGVTLCGLITNHDHPRFGNMLLRSGLVDSKYDPRYWYRHICAFAFLAQYPGIIQLFYNDEIGALVDGMKDRLKVRCADRGLCDDNMGRVQGRVDGFSVDESYLFYFIKEMLYFRKNNPDMSSKEMYIYNSDEVYMVKRGFSTIFIMNLSEVYQMRVLPSNFCKVIIASRNPEIVDNIIKIPPLSVVFLYFNF